MTLRWRSASRLIEVGSLPDERERAGSLQSPVPPRCNPQGHLSDRAATSSDTRWRVSRTVLDSEEENYDGKIAFQHRQVSEGCTTAICDVGRLWRYRKPSSPVGKNQDPYPCVQPFRALPALSISLVAR
jgi:hypothetical protein